MIRALALLFLLSGCAHAVDAGLAVGKFLIDTVACQQGDDQDRCTDP